MSAFYQAANQVAPGAWELLQDLLASWQPYALEHRWKLPDGFDARIKVMEKKEARIEVDELNHATFTYEFYENQGSKSGLSIVANVTHSVDAYVVRTINRRCNYDREVIEHAAGLVEIEMLERILGKKEEMLEGGSRVAYYAAQFERSGMPDVVIAPHLDNDNVCGLSDAHLAGLAGVMEAMLKYQPFEVITVHDEFKCGPNNMNHLRQQYINVMAELAESKLLDDLLSQINGGSCHFKKLSNNLGELVRGSNYGLS